MIKYKLKELKMNINITDEAKNKLLELMKKSEFTEPALRLMIAGYG